MNSYPIGWEGETKPSMNMQTSNLLDARHILIYSSAAFRQGKKNLKPPEAFQLRSDLMKSRGTEYVSWDFLCSVA